jgi:hypothetical protein
VIRVAPWGVVGLEMFPAGQTTGPTAAWEPLRSPCSPKKPAEPHMG